MTGCYAELDVRYVHDVSNSISIFTKTDPPVITPLQNRAVIASSYLTVNCTTTPGNPAQTSYRQTRSTDNWSQDGKTLNLLNVTKGDAVEYTCTAWNVMTPTEGSAEDGTDVDNFTAYILCMYMYI